jgi:hypothetical protein
MASGHVNRINRPNTWLHRPAKRRDDFPANPEPSTHGSTVMSHQEKIVSGSVLRCSRSRCCSSIAWSPLRALVRAGLGDPGDTAVARRPGLASQPRSAATTISTSRSGSHCW